MKGKIVRSRRRLMAYVSMSQATDIAADLLRRYFNRKEVISSAVVETEAQQLGKTTETPNSKDLLRVLQKNLGNSENNSDCRHGRRLDEFQIIQQQPGKTKKKPNSKDLLRVLQKNLENSKNDSDCESQIIQRRYGPSPKNLSLTKYPPFPAPSS